MFLPRSLERPRSGQLSEGELEGGGGEGKEKKVSKLLEPVSWKTVFTPPLSCFRFISLAAFDFGLISKVGEHR